MFKSSRPRGLELKRFLNPRQPVLSIASRDVIFCRENDSIKSVTDIMLKRFRRIPFATQNMQFKGLVGITDILNYLGGGEKFKIYNKKANGMNVPVKHIKVDHVHIIGANHSVTKALEVFKEYGRGAYPVLQTGVLKGIISEWDFIDKIRLPVDVTVEDLMTPKPIVARKMYTVWDATKMMCRGGFRRLPVTEQGILLGIVTPYDILSYLSKGERVSKHKLQSARVKTVMNSFVTTIEPEASIDQAIELMRNKKVGGLPVVEDEELVGIITERDILNALII